MDRGGEEAAAAICLTHDRWGWAHSGERIAYSQMGSPKLEAELRQISSSKWRFLPSSHLHHHFGMEGPAEHTKGVAGRALPPFRCLPSSLLTSRPHSFDGGRGERKGIMSMSRAGLDEGGGGWHAVSSRTFRLGLLACSGYYVVRGERQAIHSAREELNLLQIS